MTLSHKNRILVCTVAFLVVLSGCSAISSTPTDTPSNTEISTPISTSKPTGTPTPTGAEQSTQSEPATPTTDELAEQYGPWLGEPIAVYVESPRDRDIRANVQNATDYWEANAETYAGYAVEYRFTNSKKTADIYISFNDTLSSCDGRYDEGFLGCADLLDESEPAPGLTKIQVITGLTDRELNYVLQHEFGHTLGLEHRSNPQVMLPEIGLSYPDAAHRSNPFVSDEINVYLNLDKYGRDNEKYRKQVERALHYYADGADGHFEGDVTFTIVENESKAHIVIKPTSLPDGIASSSEPVHGYQLDDDAPLEYYSYHEIHTVADLDSDAVAWHVALQLSSTLLYEKPRPEILNSTDYYERRSAWWR